MSWVSYDTVPEGWANRILWPKYIFYLNQGSQSCIIAKLPKIETHKAPWAQADLVYSATLNSGGC